MYRFFEIIPGALAWLTIGLMVFLSWATPAFIAIFIILFDTYWLLKTVYLSLHLSATFRQMKRNLKVDWLAELKKLQSDPKNPCLTGRQANDIRMPRIVESEHSDELVDSNRISWKEIIHLIIFPIHKEPHPLVRESFGSLVKANYPTDKFIVVLATEASGGEEAAETAKKIKAEFGARFRRFLTTKHPAGLPGEIPGKGSNEAWAAKEAKRLIIDPLVNTRTYADYTQTNDTASEVLRKSASSQRESALSYENILVSVFDIDTQIFPDYFGRLTYAFLNAEDRLRAIYQPVPLFTNNIYQAPAFARVVSFSSTFWQMMQQARPERLTSFSSQSIPFQALVDMGFWHKDVVSEDSRVFWQGFLRYNGEFRVEPLSYPVSMDANVGPTFWSTMKNTYRQHRRWGWGAENIPYMLCGRQSEKSELHSNAPNTYRINNPNYSDMPIQQGHSDTSDGLVDSDRGQGFLYDKKIPLRKKWYWSLITIEGFHSWATNALMIFALGWLPLWLGGEAFSYSLLSYSLPQITSFIMSLAMLGIASSAILAILLLPPKPAWFRRWHYFLYALQWLLIPITLIVFGAFPGLDAQTRLMLGGKFRLGFWVTPKHRKV